MYLAGEYGWSLLTYSLHGADHVHCILYLQLTQQDAQTTVYATRFIRHPGGEWHGSHDSHMMQDIVVNLPRGSVNGYGIESCAPPLNSGGFDQLEHGRGFRRCAFPTPVDQMKHANMDADLYTCMQQT